MNNSSFIIHNSTTVPVYHWRGAHPLILDCQPDHTGWLICLQLTREGDTCLIPLAWDTNAFPDEMEEAELNDILPIPTFHTQALDKTAVSHTLHQLHADGWQINGRLNITFTGSHSEPNFQQNYEQYLWQTPDQKDEG